MLPVLISIHGIRTDGEWQEVIAPLLEPHFRYVPIKYDHYRKCGGIKLLFVPWILALAPIISIPAGYSLGIGIAVAAFAAVALIAHVANRGRLNQTIKHVNKLVNGIRRPRVIAHSLGSRILVGLLSHNRTWQIDRAILTGCVLPRAMNWAAYVGENGTQFSLIWNEIGRRDWVPILAGFMPNWLLRGLGSAGRFGFSPRQNDVHTSGTPFNRCACDLKVSNVMVGFDHNDFAGMRNHTIDVWLPVLLGYSPHEHKRFVDMCIDIETRDKEFTDRLKGYGDATDPELAELFETFANAVWQWTHKLPLRKLMRLWVGAQSGFKTATEEQINGATERAMKMACAAVAEARQSVGKDQPKKQGPKASDPEHQPDKLPLEALNPRIALEKAAEGVTP